MPITNPVDYAIQKTDDILDDYVIQAFTTITQGTGPFLTSLLTLYFIFIGYGIWTGKIQVNIAELINRSLKIATVLGIFLAWPSFIIPFVDFFTSGPDQLASKIIDEPSGSVFSGVGELFNKSMVAAGAVWEESSLAEALVFSAGIIIVSALLIAFIIFTIIVSKIAIAVLLGLLPLFIIFLLFEKTQGLFERYLQQLTNYFLIMVILASTISLVSLLFENIIDAMVASHGEVSFGLFGAFLAIGISSLLIIRQTPSISAAIAGGIGLSTTGTGFVNNMKNGVNRIGTRGRQAGAYAAKRLRSRNTTNSVKGI